MYEHNTLGYWSGLALCLTKVRSSRARCPATALISCSAQLRLKFILLIDVKMPTIFGILTFISRINCRFLWTKLEISIDFH